MEIVKLKGFSIEFDREKCQRLRFGGQVKDGKCMGKRQKRDNDS